MQGLASTLRDDRQAGHAGGRSVHIDMMRMACVLVWVVRHGDEDFNDNNIILDQNWSAPLLWLISGMCWGRSRTPLWIYLRRLALIFCVGTALNQFAWKVQNPAEHVDIWNVVFHMWFVAGLMVLSCATAPLKALLDASAEEKNGAILWSAAPPVLLIGVATAVYLRARSQLPVVGWQGLRWWLDGNDREICMPFVESAVALIIAAYACTSPLEHDCSIIGWVLLTYSLGAWVVYQHSKIGVESAGMNLFILGLVVERLGLWGRGIIGKFITGYWLLVLLVCGWLAIPLVNGQTDLNPSDNPVIRARWCAITVILIVAFLSAGENIQDPLNLFARFPGLNYWVVFLYVAHIAVHKIVPSPFNWMVLAVSVVPFLFISRRVAGARPNEATPIMGDARNAQEC
mmetsp:Transcript_124685/g.233147  ORF Transcript_124685/g.233147 Transcript_124685/m.233147 type:complete len:401 (-) Transcript_124685:82-1284(-)